jgi:transcriptional regulator with XRE-family HTH domain
MAKVLRNLGQVRKDKGLSPEEVAVKAGVSLRTIAKAESGKGVSLTTLKHIASGLKVKAEDLL